MGALVTDTIPYRRLLVVLCVVWFALNASVLAGGHVLPWDALDQFYPAVYFNAHALRAGMAPWWNPYIYGGYAAVGDPQGMLFSPLLMAWMMIPAHPGAGWFAWGVLLHVLMGGAAMLAVLRRHGLNALGALVGAVVYMAGGVAASRLEHVPIVLAYAYVPVVVLMLCRVLDRPGLARGALLGLAAGAFVVHLVQVTYLFVFVIAGYACVAIARAWPGAVRSFRWRLLGALLLATLVTLAIGLPQLLFSWASLQLSNRVELPLAAADVGSLDARSLLFLIYPNAYDILRDIHAAPIDPIQSYLYIGVIPMLALVGLVRAWHEPEQRRAIGLVVALAVVAGMYMFGTNTPFYGWLYTWLPGLTHFRRPADAAYVLNVALAILAGIGASHLRFDARRDVTLALGVAIAWLVAIAAVSHLLAPVWAAVIAGVALWQLRKPGTAWRAVVWLIVVLVADYRSFNFNGTFNDTGDGAARFHAQPAVRFLAEHMAEDRGTRGERFTTQGMTTLWDNMGTVDGLASTQGYNPLRYALYETWYRPRQNANEAAPPAPYNALPEARLDDLLGVRYLVIGRHPAMEGALPPPDYQKIGTFKNADVWRNDGAYPRLLNPVNATLLGLGELPDVATFAGTDFSSTLWLTPRDNDDQAQARIDSATSHGRVEVLTRNFSPSRTVLATRSVDGGWLAMGDVDHPGWYAELDGTPLMIHRANGMFRAVRVPAGDHQLTFRFSPWRMVAYAWHHRETT